MWAFGSALWVMLPWLLLKNGLCWWFHSFLSLLPGRRTLGIQRSLCNWNSLGSFEPRLTAPLQVQYTLKTLWSLYIFYNSPLHTQKATVSIISMCTSLSIYCSVEIRLLWDLALKLPKSHLFIWEVLLGSAFLLLDVLTEDLTAIHWFDLWPQALLFLTALLENNWHIIKCRYLKSKLWHRYVLMTPSPQSRKWMYISYPKTFLKPFVFLFFHPC